jgi:hypothetical protein
VIPPPPRDARSGMTSKRKRFVYHSDSEDEEQREQQERQTIDDADDEKLRVNYFAEALTSALEAPLSRAGSVATVTQLLPTEDGAIEATALTDPILAGTRTAQQRSAQRLKNRKTLAEHRADRSALLNRFHNKDPAFDENEKQLSRLACQGGDENLRCCFVFVNRMSNACVSVVQLFNVLKRERKEVALQRRQAARLKDRVCGWHTWSPVVVSYSANTLGKGGNYAAIVPLQTQR